MTQSFSRFSWLMSLFGFKQLANMLGTGAPGSKDDPVTAMDAVGQTAQSYLGETLIRVFKTGDQMLRSTMDAMFGWGPPPDWSTHLKSGLDPWAMDHRSTEGSHAFDAPWAPQSRHWPADPEDAPSFDPSSFGDHPGTAGPQADNTWLGGWGPMPGSTPSHDSDADPVYSWESHSDPPPVGHSAARQMMGHGLPAEQTHPSDLYSETAWPDTGAPPWTGAPTPSHPPASEDGHTPMMDPSVGLWGPMPNHPDEPSGSRRGFETPSWPQAPTLSDALADPTHALRHHLNARLPNPMPIHPGLGAHGLGAHGLGPERAAELSENMGMGMGPMDLAGALSTLNRSNLLKDRADIFPPTPTSEARGYGAQPPSGPSGKEPIGPGASSGVDTAAGDAPAPINAGFETSTGLESS